MLFTHEQVNEMVLDFNQKPYLEENEFRFGELRLNKLDMFHTLKRLVEHYSVVQTVKHHSGLLEKASHSYTLDVLVFDNKGKMKQRESFYLFDSSNAYVYSYSTIRILVLKLKQTIKCNNLLNLEEGDSVLYQVRDTLSLDYPIVLSKLEK